MTHHEENKLLIKNFLNRTFFKDFQDNDREVKLFDHLEMMITPKCNLTCKYCYYNHTTAYGRELNPLNISQKDNIQENVDSLLDYLERNNYVPGKLEIFSGEPLNQWYIYDIIDKCIDFYSNKEKKGGISVPSNMSFLRDDRKIEKIKQLKNKASKNGVGLGISASVDGKYMDIYNRPVGFAKNQHKFYNDEFYHKLFTFAREVGCGFHPMVYHNNIEEWKKNFDWFQENFEKYGLSWNNIYLLEVRNDGWTKDKIKYYGDFYKHVLNFVLHNKLGGDKDKFIDAFVFNGRKYKNINNMNMFNNIGKIGRGIGCSMQTTLFVRMGDLMCSSCHRQSYDMFNGFEFVKNNDNKIVDIEPKNIEYYMSTISTDRKNWPYCESCLLKEICMSGCLGAQYETNGDPFIPIPSVCLLEHGKVKSQIEFFMKNNLFGEFIEKLPKEQATAFKTVKEYIFNE